MGGLCLAACTLCDGKLFSQAGRRQGMLIVSSLVYSVFKYHTPQKLLKKEYYINTKQSCSSCGYRSKT